jgi:hypothetical protein
MPLFIHASHLFFFFFFVTSPSVLTMRGWELVPSSCWSRYAHRDNLVLYMASRLPDAIYPVLRSYAVYIAVHTAHPPKVFGVSPECTCEGCEILGRLPMSDSMPKYSCTRSSLSLAYSHTCREACSNIVNTYIRTCAVFANGPERPGMDGMQLFHRPTRPSSPLGRFRVMYPTCERRHVIGPPLSAFA